MATQTTGLTSDATEFSRDVTLFGGISILAGIMIGSGVFYLGSYVLIRSGMSMGLGYALSEEMKFDDRGRLLNGNLLDYKLPTALDHPELHALFVETEDPSGPFGNKALGEPPSIPVAPAIRNALLYATGVAVNTLPMSPQRLVEAFQRKGLI